MVTTDLSLTLMKPPSPSNFSIASFNFFSSCSRVSFCSSVSSSCSACPGWEAAIKTSTFVGGGRERGREGGRQGREGGREGGREAGEAGRGREAREWKEWNKAMWTLCSHFSTHISGHSIPHMAHYYTDTRSEQVLNKLTRYEQMCFEVYTPHRKAAIMCSND